MNVSTIMCYCCSNIYLKLASVTALRRRPPTQFHSPSTTVETHFTPATDVVAIESMSCRDRTTEFQSVIQSLQVWRVIVLWLNWNIIQGLNFMNVTKLNWFLFRQFSNLEMFLACVPILLMWCVLPGGVFMLLKLL